MSESPERPPFWSYLRSGAIMVLIASALTLAMHNTFIVKKLEVASLDGLFVLFGSHPAPDIMMVEITEDDFNSKAYFAGVSPLNRQLVTRLIEAIDAGGARAIGVDILTEEWPGAPPRGPGPHAPVVWVCGADESHGEFQLGRVMGGNDQGLHYGPAALQSLDGMVRQYYPYLRVAGRTAAVPSFSVQLARAGGDREVDRAEPDEAEFIHFMARGSSLNGMTSTTVLKASESAAWRENRPFQNKIVLLGGAYKENRDLYSTALGDMYGVEVLANILESDLAHRPVKEANWFTFIMADLVLGLAITAGAYWLPSPWGLPATLLGAPVTSMVVGLILFAGWGFFLSFMPVVVGVIIHTVVEHVQEHRNLLREHGNLKAEHRNLQVEYEKLRSLGAASDAASGSGQAAVSGEK